MTDYYTRIGETFPRRCDGVEEPDVYERRRLKVAEIWKPKDPELLRAWVDSIYVEASDELNDWEFTFIDSIYNRLVRGLQLSQAQEEKLESIYAEKTK